MKEVVQNDGGVTMGGSLPCSQQQPGFSCLQCEVLGSPPEIRHQVTSPAREPSPQGLSDSMTSVTCAQCEMLMGPCFCLCFHMWMSCTHGVFWGGNTYTHTHTQVACWASWYKGLAVVYRFIFAQMSREGSCRSVVALFCPLHLPWCTGLSAGISFMLPRLQTWWCCTAWASSMRCSYAIICGKGCENISQDGWK